jgi:hypothetical protein
MRGLYRTQHSPVNKQVYGEEKTPDPFSSTAGTVRLALERGPGQTVATIPCDSSAKYQSKLFNPEWQAANGLRTDLSVDTLVAKL